MRWLCANNISTISILIILVFNIKKQIMYTIFLQIFNKNTQFQHRIVLFMFVFAVYIYASYLYNAYNYIWIKL